MIDPENVYHLYPHDEEDDHIVFLTYQKTGEPYSECKCQPWFKLQDNGLLIVVHASFHGQQAVDWANEILNKK